MKLYGKAHRFGDNVNTDYIISVKRKRDTIDDNELAKYLMEDIEPGFYKRITPGDFIVAGQNFGCGSSREAAPRVILAAGIKAVIAKSFARIFYRNAINIGLLLFECDTDKFETGDVVEIDVDTGRVNNHSKDISLATNPLPDIMMEILKNGGLVPYLKKEGNLVIG
jgi:3-isopropylmalate/(R)-2-methylmalate dehydratase small subunit